MNWRFQYRFFLRFNLLWGFHIWRYSCIRRASNCNCFNLRKFRSLSWCLISLWNFLWNFFNIQFSIFFLLLIYWQFSRTWGRFNWSGYIIMSLLFYWLTLLLLLLLFHEILDNIILNTFFEKIFIFWTLWKRFWITP